MIRAAGERTEELCKKLILDQGFTEEDVVLIREIPFSKALLKSFDLAIRHGKKWTFCVDADVLLRPGSIQEMIRLADAQPQNVCQVQGYILDKFFGGVRKGGVHLYRTSLLKKVKEKVPKEGTDIRPESYALRQMEDDGFPTRFVPYVVGLHDFEQYHYDIYRKAFVQAVKHLSRAELFIRIWKNNVSDDPDFKVALKGFSDSIRYNKPIFINSELNIYKKLFEESGIQEKQELDVDEFTLETVDDAIASWTYSDIYYSFFPDKDGFEAEMRGYWRKFQKNSQEKGLIKSIRKAVGEIFLRIGKKIR